MAETLYQKRTKVRRMSDIERLASQYKKNVEAMTGEYQQSFGEFEANRVKAMEPYNLAMEQYKTQFADYEKQAAGYRERLGAYQKAIEDFPTSAGEKVNAPVYNSKAGKMYQIGGTSYLASDLPVNYFLADVMGEVPEMTTVGVGRGARQVATGKMTTKVVGQEVRKRTPPGKFTEKAPEAPTAPTMPELAEFDSSSLAARRGELEATFKREVGERKAARLGAVSRRATRPMLQET
jgi:hypothetical protein